MLRLLISKVSSRPCFIMIEAMLIGQAAQPIECEDLDVVTKHCLWTLALVAVLSRVGCLVGWLAEHIPVNPPCPYSHTLNAAPSVGSAPTFARKGDGGQKHALVLLVPAFGGHEHGQRLVGALDHALNHACASMTDTSTLMHRNAREARTARTFLQRTLQALGRMRAALLLLSESTSYGFGVNFLCWLDLY